MAYTGEISRKHPACVLFVIDQSASMEEEFGNGTRASEVARVLNQVLAEFVLRCNKDEGIRDYFHIGVIGYGRGAGNALNGPLSEQILNPVTLIAANARQVVVEQRKSASGTSGTTANSRVWVEPATGGQTPMCEAFRLAGGTLIDWCKDHMDSYPPVVIHLSDGGPTDGDPRPIAEMIRQICTNDGDTILMNVHIASSGPEIAFPVTEKSVETGYAQVLFNMSSVVPEPMRAQARERGYKIAEGARAFMYNARFEQVAKFFDIGTHVSYSVGKGRQ